MTASQACLPRYLLCLTSVWVSQAASSSDSDEEDFLPIKRTAQQRSKRIEEEEEEEEEEESLTGKAPGRQAKKAKVSGELLEVSG